MPGDNVDPINDGEDVEFPQNGPAAGTSVTRAGNSSFTLSEPGVYMVMFQVSVTGSGQLVLTLNGQELGYTVVGRTGGNSQIVGMALVNVTESSVLTVRNPAGNSSSLEINDNAGGSQPVSAHLVITQISSTNA